jgi:serine/threonine protein kinase
MNPLFDAYTFPAIKSTPMHKVFPRDTPTEALDLLKTLLVYEPDKRPAPLAALAHPFFDELRLPNVELPDGKRPPDLFNFSEEERKTVSADVLRSLIPDWYQPGR